MLTETGTLIATDYTFHVGALAFSVAAADAILTPRQLQLGNGVQFNMPIMKHAT